MKGTIMKSLVWACLLTRMFLLPIVSASNLDAQNNVWPCGNNPDLLIDQRERWASMLRISKSQIQTYLICPRKFWFQYVVAQMAEFLPASLPFGTALHAAVAAFYKSMKETGTKPELESMTREFATVWEREVAGK